MNILADISPLNVLATKTDLIMGLPILVLLATGLLLMLMDAFKKRQSLPIIAGIGIIISMIVACPPVLQGIAGVDHLAGTAYSGMLATGEMASLVHIFLAASGLFTLFFVGDYMKRQAATIPDIYAIMVFSLIGMSMLANANDLIITFIGLETMSICLYIMASMYKKSVASNESGLKYFLLGAFATGFFLYGIALIYGASGSTNFDQMNFTALAQSPLFYPGIGMLIIGFLFKVSAFPFHAWTPDVYTGTPTPLAGFMATGSKAAAFIALAGFINESQLLAGDSKIQMVIAVAAVATMIYGNIVAARQRNLKRMLAYSSIAHSGYVLLAVCCGPEGKLAVIFYMVIYTFMNIGAFGLVGMAENKMEDGNLDSWKGFGRHNPWLGLALTIFLFSLAGIPPLAGFMGKYFVFAAAIRADLLIPAIIGILTSVVGAFYYINVIKTMYFEDKESPKVVVSKSMMPLAGVALLAILVLLLGVLPSLLQTPLAEGINASTWDMLPEISSLNP